MPVVLVALTALQLALCITSMRGDSATADEGAHIAAGYIKVVYGRLDFFREQPPLMNSITALPLVMAGYNFPLPAPGPANHWGVGHQYLYGTDYDPARILFLARLPTLVLFVSLAWIAFWFVRVETGSAPWGVAAFCLVAFCPNLIAHGRLATVDMAATFFCFLSGVFLVRLIRGPGAWPAIGLGIAAVSAALSKISGLIVAPWSAAVVVLALVTRRIPRDQHLRLAMSLAITCVTAVTVSILVVAGEASQTYVQRQYGDVSLLTLPFREMAANLQTIRAWYAGSNFAAQYFLGQFSQRGWWHYYPVAMGLKMTIPSLAISMVGIVFLFVRRKATFGAVAAFLFAVLFLAAAMSGDLALGLRYVLPVLPFLYAAAIIVIALNAGRRLTIAVALLLAWHIGETVATHPLYIGYFNQFIGSHRNADRYLIDSNLDWGQDLRRLDAWCRERGVERIAVAYFGGGDLNKDLSIEKIGVWSIESAGAIPPGHFAVSRHLYRMSAWRAVSPRSWESVIRERRGRYAGTAGHSIDVYELP